MFFGQHYHNIDKKGRVFVPAKYRAELGDEFMLSRSPDGKRCLCIYPMEEWLKIDEKLKALADSEAMDAWRKDTGYDSFMELVTEKNAVITEPFSVNVTKFVSKESDDMSILIAAIKDTMVQASWKMVYAETDAEFEKLWDDMVADCEGLEIQKIIDWRLEELEKATQIRDSLAN